MWWSADCDSVEQRISPNKEWAGRSQAVDPPWQWDTSDNTADHTDHDHHDEDDHDELDDDDEEII